MTADDETVNPSESSSGRVDVGAGVTKLMVTCVLGFRAEDEEMVAVFEVSKLVDTSFLVVVALDVGVFEVSTPLEMPFVVFAALDVDMLIVENVLEQRHASSRNSYLWNRQTVEAR